MNAIIYEEVEDFLDRLKTADKISTIYVTCVRMTKNNLVSGMVKTFFIDEKGIAHVHQHTEDIPTVEIKPDALFAMISDDELRNNAYTQYRGTFDKFEEALFKELDKMKAVLRGLGFTKIVHASLG
jgi:hypothetical protein